MMLLLGYVLLVFLSVSVSSKKENVLIVGGGLSGLSAALELERQGYSTTLVEASHRLGGRISSLDNGIELGGTYLHGSSNALSRIIHEKYKLPTVISGGASAHPGKASAVWIYEEQVLNKTQTEERSSILYQQWLDEVQTALRNYTSREHKNEQKTVEYLHSTSQQVIEKLTCSTSSRLDRALLEFELQMGFEHDFGVPFSQLAVEGLDQNQNWDWVDHEGPDRVLRDGLTSLVQAMQNDLSGDILLNTPVKRISYTNGKCVLTLSSSDGDRVLTSNACVVTLPLGVLKQHHATMFDPPLPLHKQDVLQRTGVAAYNTLVLKWNQPICESGAYYLLNENEENPLSSGFVCPQVLRTTSYTSTSSTVTQFHISGSEHPFQNTLYWKRKAVQVMNQVFPSRKLLKESDILELHISAWHEDPFILGSYSAPTTSTRGNVDRAILQESLGNIVFFAGEHTNTCGRYQSLDGAYDTGVHAARQVDAALRESEQYDNGNVKLMTMACDGPTTVERHGV